MGVGLGLWGWVGAWGMSIERSQLQSNESRKPLAKNLIRPEGRGGNYIWVASKLHTIYLHRGVVKKEVMVNLNR